MSELDSSKNPQISRRDFLRFAGTGMLASATIDILDVLANQERSSRSIKVRHFALPISGLNPDLDGSLIFQLNDIHVDSVDHENPTLMNPNTTPIVAQVIKSIIVGMQPPTSILAMPGDFVTTGIDRTSDKNYGTTLVDLEAAVQPFIGACDKSFFSYGNHEMSYRKFSFLRPILEKAGFEVLGLNGKFVAQYSRSLGINVIGLPDYTTQSNLFGHNLCREVVEQSGNFPLNIVLCHNAQGVEDGGAGNIAKMTNKPMVVLSGHTHGGHFDVNPLHPFQSLAHYLALARIGYPSSLVNGLYQLTSTGVNIVNDFSEVDSSQVYVSVDPGLGLNRGERKYMGERVIPPNITVMRLVAA